MTTYPVIACDRKESNAWLPLEDRRASKQRKWAAQKDGPDLLQSQVVCVAQIGQTGQSLLTHHKSLRDL